jgi:16S rRNA (cytidine1402-2'-O)-methyltransferase
MLAHNASHAAIPIRANRMLDSLKSLLERQDFPAGALYVVATPIGNAADIGLRALHVLRLVDCIAAEDTRNTRQLLQRYGIEGPQLLAAHEHNEREAAQRIVAALQAGQRVALVSDAGTPAVSDPGARLVQDVRAAGLRVVPVPGASSITAALCAAGVVSQAGAFHFAGFLPAKAGERQARLQTLQALDAALVFLEAPHRVAQTVADLAERLPERATITFARELTKQFEEIATVPLGEAGAWLAADPYRLKGEYVLILSAPAASAADALDPEALRMLDVLLAELPLKQAVGLAAKLSGAPRNRLYQEALARQKD